MLFRHLLPYHEMWLPTEHTLHYHHAIMESGC